MILHGPPVPTKLPSDIPKFEGKNGEDPGDHVTTFHLWCSSNSLNDDSIRLRLFQRTLIGVAVKWYIELPRGAYGTFSQLVMVFLNHFQLPIRYDVGLELLSTLRQDTATHISDHIQEWRRWKRLIKTPIPPTFLLEWFLKSLHPPISKDVATSGVTTEEEAIFRAQQLDLIYAQSGMLYHLLPDAPRSTYDPRQKSRTSCRWHCRFRQCKVRRLGDKPFERVVSKPVCRRTNFVCVFQSHSGSW
jgi:hypothetical protein